jgi:hypothetical protein
MLRVFTTAAIIAVGLVAEPPVFAQTSQLSHPAATKDTLNREDRTFVKEAASGVMAEVELSRIAQKSENAARLSGSPNGWSRITRRRTSS